MTSLFFPVRSSLSHETSHLTPKSYIDQVFSGVEGEFIPQPQSDESTVGMRLDFLLATDQILFLRAAKEVFPTLKESYPGKLRNSQDQGRQRFSLQSEQ